MTVRDQASLFALMVVARPATNRELRELAGLEITAEVRRHVNRTGERIATSRQGAVHTHQLTPEGRSWCESALTAGRPDGAKFPAGALFAVLDSVGQYLARSGTKFDEFFQPDVESWIRAAYTEAVARRRDKWLRLATLRPWLEGAPRDIVDVVLDRMAEASDVRLIAGPHEGLLKAEDRAAAVEIGGEARHLLRIDPA